MARSQRKRPKSKSAAILVFAVLAACNRERPVSQTPKPASTPPKPAVARIAPQADTGEVMPAYSAKLLDGKSFDVAAEKGNVVLLNVWATYCGPCRTEIPELQALYKKYEARGFKVVGVSVDDEGAAADVKKFVAETQLTYPVAIDPELRVAGVLRTTVLPTSVLVSRDGHIVWRKVGAVQPNEMAALDTLIEKALKSSGGPA